MRGGAEGISDDEEGHIFVFGAGVDAVRLRLDHVTIGQDDVLAVESLLIVQRSASAAEWSASDRGSEQAQVLVLARCWLQESRCTAASKNGQCVSEAHHDSVCSQRRRLRQANQSCVNGHDANREKHSHDCASVSDSRITARHIDT